MGCLSRPVIRRRPSVRFGAAALVLLLAVTTVGATDTESGSTESVPSLEELLKHIQRLEERIDRLGAERNAEIERLRTRIEELEQELRREESQQDEDELGRILAEAEEATAEQEAEDAEAAEQRKRFVGRQRNLQALNPEISFLGDVSYEWTDNDVRDGFLLRGVELAFQAPLDPYTRFKGILAAHQEPALLHQHDDGVEPQEGEHGHEHDHIEVGVEEAYMEWVALPLHSRLRVGKFRQQFGTLNRWHPHALSSVDVPFAIRNAFGHDGLVGLGVGMDFQLPGLWASSNGLTFEIVNADNASAFAGSEFRDPAYLLRHTGFYDLGPDTYLEFGLNAVTGPNNEEGNLDTTVSSVDFNFVWEPIERARYRGLEVRGEYMHTRFETADVGALSSDSLYTYVSWKLGRKWIVGVRYDDAELPWPRLELFDEQPFTEGLREQAWSPFLTMWQSEFVRLRFQYQHASRDFAWAHGPDDDDRVFVQATFAAGPHKHEAY